MGLPNFKGDSLYVVFYPPPSQGWASLVAQLVKNPPATHETWVQSLGWEDPLEKGKATHSSTLAWWFSQLRSCLQCRRPRVNT